MTNTLAVAIVLLVFTFYISSLTLVYPLAFSYLLLIYGLKDLPKSKYKATLWILSILGILFSLIQPTLFIAQEIIVLICVMICALMMDQKSYHGILSGITIAILLPMAQMLHFEKNNSISGFVISIIVLLLALYYFYYHFNLYLSDLDIPRKIEKRKKYLLS